MRTNPEKLKHYLIQRCRDLNLKAFELNFQHWENGPQWMICGNGKLFFLSLKPTSTQSILEQKNLMKILNEYGGSRMLICPTVEKIDAALGSLCFI